MPSEPKTKLTPEQFLTLDDHPQTHTFHFTHDQFLLWPLVRYLILTEIQLSRFGIKLPTGLNKTVTARHLSYLYHTLFNSLWGARQGSDILIFSSTVVNVPARNHQYFNRLYDHYASLLEPKTQIIEDSYLFNYRRPRTFQHVKYHDLLYITALLKSKLSVLTKEDENTIREFIKFIKTTVGFELTEQFYDRLTRILYTYARILPHLHDEYSRLWKKLRPKIIFLEDASYGTKSYILKWAKDSNIATGEFQHGLLSKMHLAYYYSNKIISSSYKQYLPDYLLSYGSYWHSQINTPTKPVAIGNPHLTEYLNSQHSKKEPRDKKSILIISSACIPDKLRQFVLTLIARLGTDKFRVILRPHPSEIHLLEERYSEVVKSGGEINAADLYDALAQTDVVVGLEPSTALLEAMAFQTKIFIPKDPAEDTYFNWHIDPALFDAFENIDHLADLIRKNSGRTYTSDHLWDPNWKRNYLNFMNSLNISSPAV